MLPLELPEHMMSHRKLSEAALGTHIAAQGLRHQAAACRQLANVAHTSAGKSSMGALASNFDGEAMRPDPSSERR
jgi:hypothetical protein